MLRFFYACSNYLEVLYRRLDTQTSIIIVIAIHACYGILGVDNQKTTGLNLYISSHESRL